MFERSKRKSFLFFGGSNQDQRNKSQETSNSRNSSSAKALPQHKPLHKQPLNNTQMLKDEVEPLSELKTNDNNKGPQAERLQQNIPIRQATIGRRRPPPPVDISNFRRPLKSEPSVSTVTSTGMETGTISSTSPAEVKSGKSPQQSFTTPEVRDLEQQMDEQNFQPGHQRQRSEVEQLVDHLDDFINQSSADVENTPGYSDGGEIPLRQLDTKVDTVSDAESAKNITPLYGRSEATEDISESDVNYSDGEPSMDEMFSFNESINKKNAITDLQQSTAASSLSDVGGIPTSSRFVVTNADQTSGSESEENYADLHEYEAGYDQMPEPEQEHGSTDEDDLYQMIGGSEYERRNFRVVNEEKPNFYFNDSTSEDDNSYMNTDTNSITASLARRSSLSSSKKGAASSLLSNTESRQSSALEAKSIDNDTINTTPSSEFKKSLTKGSIPDKNVRLISSYIEELRLLYFPTSNSLQLPPDLPYALKNKNTLEQPQNIKVTIRTSTRQVGIKHGKAKQKLLSLETTKEEEEEEENNSTTGLKFNTESTKVDHTKEFHTLFNKDEKISEADQDILDDIPGDEAYDSDDLMAPLRENPKQRIHDEVSQTRLKRSDTVSSYFTRNAGRMRSGTLDVTYSPQLPLDLRKYNLIEESQKPCTPAVHEKGDTNPKSHKSSISNADDDYELDVADFGYYRGTAGTGLHITNPDSE